MLLGIQETFRYRRGKCVIHDIEQIPQLRTPTNGTLHSQGYIAASRFLLTLQSGYFSSFCIKTHHVIDVVSFDELGIVNSDILGKRFEGRGVTKRGGEAKRSGGERRLVEPQVSIYCILYLIRSTTAVYLG